ncbi:hypothetical protein BHM03_00005026 [Ensete ventricosum]|nr:hypothetical protein BHM03_00005026 [Ensete ventricosum]
MVSKFISFLSIGGRSPASLAVEVLLLSTATSFPSRQPSSSSPPLLAELPRLSALVVALVVVVVTVALNLLSSAAVFPYCSSYPKLSQPPCEASPRLRKGYSSEQQECLGPCQRPPLWPSAPLLLPRRLSDLFFIPCFRNLLLSCWTRSNTKSTSIS